MDITTSTPSTIKPSPLPSALTCTAGVVGNVLAMVVLYKSSQEQKRTVFYRLVGILALTDLLGIIASSPVVFLVYANNLEWVGGQSLCHYNSFMMIFFGYSTVFIIGVMGIERYLALMHPFVYSEKVTTSKMTQTLIGLYIAAVVLGLLPIMGLGNNVIHYPGTWCFFNFNGKSIEDSIYAYIYSSIGFCMILLLIIMNCAVIVALAKMRRSSAHLHFTSTSRTPEKETQMIIFLAGITFIFVTCWSPLMVLVLIKQVGTINVEDKVDLTVIRFASFNQILDPWVYILFRKSLFTTCYGFIRKTICAVTGNNESNNTVNSTANENNSIATTVQTYEPYAYSNGSVESIPNGDHQPMFFIESNGNGSEVSNGMYSGRAHGSINKIPNGIHKDQKRISETRF